MIKRRSNPFVIRLTVVFLCLFLSVCRLSFSDQETFPFIAEVTADNVNVRAGQSFSFENLARLNKTDEIVVIDRQYGWYKIQLPVGVHSYIFNDFVLVFNGLGEVRANRVNVRARPNTSSTVIGQLANGDRVTVLEGIGDWYKIQPVKSFYGWVSDRFLTFKSNIPKEPDAAQIIPKAVDIEEISISLEPAEADTVQKSDKPREEKNIHVVGILEKYQDSHFQNIQYKIIVDGRTPYYIEGLTYLLEGFVGFKISVKGILDVRMSGQYSYPMIKVSEFQLIL